jgi:tripartite-type tricarboxylate transporter receptor subunit TctC
MSKIAIAIVVTATCAALGSTRVAAQITAAGKYPTKPIRFIIANTTGTSVDTLARIVGSKMSELLGQQMVADNRGGAGGLIGAEIAAHAAPDGHTLLVSSTGMQVITPQIYRKLNYHPVNDFAAISLFAVTQNILVVHPALPVNNVKELIAHAKANPGKLNMANAGAGFQSHLAGVLFTHRAGVDIHHVPYKGGASLIAVMGNEAQLQIAPAPSLMTHVRSGRLRALASGGEKRSPATPELPTIAESGVPGYLSTGWAGLMAPKNTPKLVIGTLHATLVKAVADSATRELMGRQGAEPVTGTGAEMVMFIQEEYRRFGEAIKLAQLKVE